MDPSTHAYWDGGRVLLHLEEKVEIRGIYLRDWIVRKKRMLDVGERWEEAIWMEVMACSRDISAISTKSFMKRPDVPHVTERPM